MAEFTRPATWEDLRTIARYLADAGARYALVGGYAIAAHGFVRFSEDIDILVDPARDNTPRWVSALAKLPDGAVKELAGDDGIFEREGNYAIRINDEFTVDVLPAACGHSWKELSAFIEEVVVDEVPIRVLSLEGLLLTKEGMRDRDRADAAVLRAALEKLRAKPR